MKNMVMAVLMLLSVVPGARAVPWNYQGDEWPIPSDMRTQKDYQQYVSARKWMFAGGCALLLGSYIANKNATGLSHKADHMQVLGPIQTRPSPGGGMSAYFPIIQEALESQGRVRAKSDAYRKGAIIGAMLAVVCFQVSYSLRF